jgi:hypothetical protein
LTLSGKCGILYLWYRRLTNGSSMPALLASFAFLFVCFTNQGQIGLDPLCPQHEEMLCFQLNPKSTMHTMVAQSHSATPTTTPYSRITYAPNAITHALLRHALSIYATYKKPLIPTNAYYVTHVVRCLPSRSPSVSKAEYCLSTKAPQPTSATLRCSSN